MTVNVKEDLQNCPTPRQRAEGLCPPTDDEQGYAVKLHDKFSRAWVPHTEMTLKYEYCERANLYKKIINNSKQYSFLYLNFSGLLVLHTWTWAGGPRSDVGAMFRRGDCWCVGLRGDWGIRVPELVIGCSVEKASILPSTETTAGMIK